MNRYKMLLGSDGPKDKSGKSSEPTEKVISFGFERNSIETTEKKEQKVRYYRPTPGVTDRIWVLYRDSSDVFVGSQVHYAGRYILCKSDSHHKELCCTETLRHKPQQRFACIIAKYPYVPSDQTQAISVNDFELMVWTFGRRILEIIISIGNNHDLIVTGIEQQYNPCDISMASTSIRLNAQECEALLVKADAIRPTLPSYLGQDLPLDEILRIYREPQPIQAQRAPQTMSLRPAEPIRPTPPFRRPVTQRRRAPDENEDIEGLGNLLDSL